MKKPQLQLSHWRLLVGGWGDALAVDGSCSIAASANGVSIWDGERKLRTVIPAGAFAIGQPRLCSGRIFYGTGYERTRDDFHALPLPVVPGGPRCAAWHADGRRVAILWVRGAEGRVVALGADGKVLRDVWTGTPPPAALWYGANSIVGIGLHLQVWREHGENQAQGHAGGVAAISATQDESQLLTVGWEGVAKLWRTQTWSVIGEWQGDWAGGAITPDGQYIVLLTRDQGLQCVRIDGARLRPTGAVQLAEPLVAIALGNHRIIASFRNPPRVQAAEFHIRSR
jgi:hypothetical protein